MPLHMDDLPTEQADIEQDASDFTNDLSIDECTDIMLILGQLDPTEVVNGEPRWTEEQRDLILKALDKVNNWKSDEDDD